MSKKTLLIVEDELGPRESLRMILKNRLKISAVGSGGEAIETLRDQSFDLVSVDLKLPDMSGTEIVKYLKNHAPGTEILVITGYGSYENLVEIYLSGATITLIKPFDVADLKRKIEQAFLRKQINRRIAGTISWLEQALSADNEPGTGINRSTLTALKKRITHIENLTGFYVKFGCQAWKLARRMGERLNLPGPKMELLETGCYLHHLGKMGFCYPVYLHDGAVSPAEQVLLRKYPEETVTLLKQCGLQDELYELLLHCEERYDGSGYPCGLKGDQIPVTARILQCCIRILSLIPHNPLAYKLAGLPEMADHIRAAAGSFISPELVDIFFDLTREGYQETGIAKG
jgi:response regulator RpfG family c-di-GMP phosphodiesterase